MVPLTTPVMTVTNANGVYEIALEEETCVMLQQQEQQQLEKQQLREKQQLESSRENQELQSCDTQQNYKQLLQQRQQQQQQVIYGMLCHGFEPLESSNIFWHILGPPPPSPPLFSLFLRMFHPI